MNNWKKLAISVCALAIAAASLAGCGSEIKPIGRDTSTPTINVMTAQSGVAAASDDSPVVAQIEKKLGEAMSKKYNKQYDKIDLDINWVASASYGEKVTAAMGASEYPHVMLVTSRTSSVIQNSKIGTFWDLSGKFEEKDADGNLKYPYLAQSNPVVNQNISVDGKLYGIYRARAIPRQGMTYRDDWTKKLLADGVLDFGKDENGVAYTEPQTIDDLDAMVKAFTENDPNGNGKKDTYGMIITSYIDGPVQDLSVWCGAPNEWGYDAKTDEWKPAFMSEGYFKALTLIRDWYKKGYINQNMVSLDPNKWDEDFLNGKGGIQIDVADRARRNAAKFLDADGKIMEGIVNVIGAVKKNADSEYKIRPTTGYNGYYVIPQPAVPDEADLDFILSVLDASNSEEIVALCNYGIEGTHYDIVKDGPNKGRIELRKGEDGKNLLASDYADLNQFSMGVAPNGLKTVYTSSVAEKVAEVQDDVNAKYAVMSPMAPYTSKAYATSGTMMDAIISEARTNYLVGKLDEAGYKKAVEEWKKMDGEKVMQEYKEAFDADPLNKGIDMKSKTFDFKF